MIIVPVGKRIVHIGDGLQITQPRGGAAVSSLLTDLVSYWTMDEATGAVRVDSHSTNDFTDNNNCAQVAGVIANAAEVDDTFSQYLSHVDNAELSANGDQDFTWAFWFQNRNLWALDYLITKWQGGGTNNDEFYIGWNARTLNFTVKAIDNSTQTVSWGAILAANTWYFAVCWRDAVNINIDIDDSGVPATAAWGKNQKDSTQALWFGRLGGIYADAYFDEVGFWKRVLTAAERTELWNGGAGLTYPF